MAVRVLTVGRRIGSLMLAGGAQTEDIEATILAATRALGLPGTDVVVTFATISLSWSPGGGAQPLTLVHLVRERNGDISAQADVTTLVRRLATGDADLADAEAALDARERGVRHHPRALTAVAPALSAAGATLIFGGSLLDLAVTALIVLAVQPALALLDRSAMVPFFQLVAATLITTLGAVVVAGLVTEIHASLVLTGAILRFLPGGALVAGVRDLIDGSIVSGTARLAEALLLAAGVAAGATVGLAVGAAFEVPLSLSADGPVDWPAAVVIAGSVVAAVGYAVLLGVPRFVLPGIALAVAIGAATGFVLPAESAVVTFVAGALIGGVARMIALRAGAPASLWVVPAILPLLPGLALVNALLATSDTAKVAGLMGAITTAFALGTGVAMGDLAAAALVRVRQRVVEPAVAVAHQGVDVLVGGAQERIGGWIRRD
ncbi:MAG: threonine/serine exporter family protein [Chloroflexi bacterium]|nr:threonine/serine exporter family protein [Chloroflexota bacterium]